MKIRWLGHACFLLSSSKGTRILTDPYDESTGYIIPLVEADYVTVSHSHFDHSTVSAVQGNPKVISGRGDFSLDDVVAHGSGTWHDDMGGARRGPNTVYVFDIDDIRVCHLGDLGHLLNAQQKAEIGKVDVLMVPTGGTYTINAQKAWQVCQQLNPHVVIPMHYRTDALAFPLDKLSSFIAEAGGANHTGTTTVELDKAGLSTQMRAVYVLEYR